MDGGVAEVNWRSSTAARDTTAVLHALGYTVGAPLVLGSLGGRVAVALIQDLLLLDHRSGVLLQHLLHESFDRLSNWGFLLDLNDRSG